jgi:hypothetical protein
MLRLRNPLAGGHVKLRKGRTAFMVGRASPGLRHDVKYSDASGNRVVLTHRSGSFLEGSEW